MKKLGGILLIGTVLLASPNLLHAQFAPADSIVQATAEAQGLELIAPADLPVGGTFWLVTTNGITAPSPCPPGNLSDFPVYAMADGIFLVDETGGQVMTNENANTVESALAAQADAVTGLINQIQDAQDAQSDGGLTLSAGRGAGMAMMMASFSSMMTPAYNTNGLWLEITNVANGWSYFNLHNGTNFVYAILSTTSLAGGSWNIETELFPTLDQTNVMPFAVQNSGRQTLLVKAMDWTGVTENGNTVPDWWLWEYYGTTALSDSSLDSQGNRLDYDYTYGLDPNIITFSLAVTNNYVNSMSAPVQLEIASGTPNYYAVSVDDTNYAVDANWQIYAGTNLTVNLGLTEGWHDVWIGLKGLPASATQAWQYKRLNLAFTPSALVLTSPTGGMVTQPMIQLAGYSPKALGSISYDLDNAAGLVTNQPVLIIDQHYDPGTFESTTNTFQAFDIPLTNGVNTITIHATDLAGNVATLVTNFTLDYSSKTNPPNVQITWPRDGEKIGANNFTMDGQLDDPTATVTAQITGTNGTAQTVNGLVDRNGKFWVENLPLGGGANLLTLTVTDAVGNTNATTLNIIQSPLVFAMDPVTPDSQLWQPTVNLTGTISAPDYPVWVNGVKGHNHGDGTWSCNNVPVNNGGTARFEVVAYAPTETQPDGSVGN